MMSSVARFQLSYQRHLKPSFIKLTKSKVISVQILEPKWEKAKKWENIFWDAKRGNKIIINRGRFQGLQIGVRGITNRGSLRDFKSGQKDYKLGLRFQIGARGITNRGSLRYFKSGQKDYKLGQKDFKSGQGLQIDTEQLSILFKFSSDNKLSSNIAIF